MNPGIILEFHRNFTKICIFFLEAYREQLEVYREQPEVYREKLEVNCQKPEVYREKPEAYHEQPEVYGSSPRSSRKLTETYQEAHKSSQ